MDAVSPNLEPPVTQTFVREVESGLYLPDRLATPRTPSGLEWYRARGTWGEVYDTEPTWDDIVSRLSEYGLGQVLSALGGVSAVLNSYQPLAGQRRIIAAFFESPDQVGRDIQSWWDRMKPQGMTDLPLFFTEPQLVALAKMALLACPPITQTRVSSLQPLGESLLMVSDLIDRETASDLPSGMATRAEQVPWLRFLVTNGLFNASDDMGHALARAYDLYLTDRPELRDAPEYVDLPNRFREITGVDPDLALATGIALLARWRTVDRRADRPPGPLSLEAYSSSFNLTNRETENLANFLSISAKSARAELQERGVGAESLRPYDILPLADKPLVRLEGRLYCPSVRLLRWKLTTGLHHVFLGSARSPEGARHLGYSGRIFEHYVDTLLRRIFPPRARRYMGERDLKEASADGKACDGAILYGESVVLVEVKATLFPHAVRAGGDFNTLKGKVRDIFGDAAEQFDGTIRAFEDGRLEEWIRPSQISSYLPLVITLDTLPITPFFYQVIEEDIAGRRALAHPKVRPLQTMAISELELLEEYFGEGGSLARLLEERVANDTYRDDCIKNYLLARDGRKALRSNPHLLGRYESLVKRSMESLKSRAAGE